MSSRDNKSYVKVKKELSKIHKISQYQALYNNLITVINNTEDTVLQSLLNNYCASITEIIRKQSMPMSCSNLIQQLKPLKTEIIDYCNSIIEQNKPEWQIIAERNGWVPYNK
jgi:hypothetical protein